MCPEKVGTVSGERRLAQRTGGDASDTDGSPKASFAGVNESNALQFLSSWVPDLFV